MLIFTVIPNENEAGVLIPSLNCIVTLYGPENDVDGLIVYTPALYVTNGGYVVVIVIGSESGSL